MGLPGLGGKGMILFGLSSSPAVRSLTDSLQLALRKEGADMPLFPDSRSHSRNAAGENMRKMLRISRLECLPVRNDADKPSGRVPKNNDIMKRTTTTILAAFACLQISPLHAAQAPSLAPGDYELHVEYGVYDTTARNDSATLCLAHPAKIEISEAKVSISTKDFSGRETVLSGETGGGKIKFGTTVAGDNLSARFGATPTPLKEQYNVTVTFEGDVMSEVGAEGTFTVALDGDKEPALQGRWIIAKPEDNVYKDEPVKLVGPKGENREVPKELAARIAKALLWKGPDHATTEMRIGISPLRVVVRATEYNVTDRGLSRQTMSGSVFWDFPGLEEALAGPPVK